MLVVQCCALLMIVVGVAGHGRLMDPPARNAMWRFGFNNPVNYNDNELYCGGFVVHYQKNKGNCGVCGDDYREKSPRSHEAGGLYGNGVIGKHYVTGQKIEVEAELTTNHKGTMKIELCPNDDPYKIATDDCFQRHVLPVVKTGEALFKIPEESKKYEIYRWEVKLPEGVSCSHCLIRWTYYAGNTWGNCNNGSESIGCGNQETFINCADVTININTPTHVAPDFNPWLNYFKNNIILQQLANQNTGLNEVAGTDNLDILAAISKQIAHLQNQTRQTTGEARPALPWMNRPVAIRTQLCVPTDRYKGDKNMATWCMVNCLKFNAVCPPEYCRCVHECKPVGSFARVEDSDVWCHQNCLKHPSHCPEDRCSCF